MKTSKRNELGQAGTTPGFKYPEEIIYLLHPQINDLYDQADV